MNKLQDINNIQDMLSDIKNLKDGWYNGDGNSYDKTLLNWFINMFDKYYDKQLKLPYIFPVPDLKNNLSLEYDESIILKIDLQKKLANLSIYDLNDDSNANDKQYILNINKEQDWIKLNEILLNNIKK